MDPQINRYYEKGFEADRLFMNAEGELEFVRTQEIISRYLPPPPAIVLDIGGGPGAYALWLASLGYQVHLVDLVPLHLEQARTSSAKQSQRPIQTITLGDARNLEHTDGFADVILLLGPLYHLTKRDDRLLALREAWRVLKPDGLLFAVGISRFASTLAGLIDGLFQDPDFVNIAHRDVREGQHRNPTDKANYFTTAFFHHPDELQGELMEAGFKLGSLLAVEGIAVFLQDLDAQWQDPIRRERILESARWLESEPSVLGVTGHIIAIAEKTKPG